ncbi:MAG: hypothetical protein JKY49_14890 [Cohaesibacteraceae bacterium]|nr:hypothetical protein [Cohaesibacteraceae bacterium]
MRQSNCRNCTCYPQKSKAVRFLGTRKPAEGERRKVFGTKKPAEIKRRKVFGTKKPTEIKRRKVFGTKKPSGGGPEGFFKRYSAGGGAENPYSIVGN